MVVLNCGLEYCGKMDFVKTYINRICLHIENQVQHNGDYFNDDLFLFLIDIIEKRGGTETETSTQKSPTTERSCSHKHF